MNDSRIDAYLRSCRVMAFSEPEETHLPPTADEVRTLLDHLHGCRPVIVGSVAVAHWLTAPIRKVRPTTDIDVFVHRKAHLPPPGWSLDPESPGVPSLISPSGGYADIMVADAVYVNGARNPRRVRLAPAKAGNWPVAHVIDLLLMKLNTDRIKDVADAVALVTALGGVPAEIQSSKKLTPTQIDNLGTVTMWIAKRPSDR